MLSERLVNTAGRLANGVGMPIGGSGLEEPPVSGLRTERGALKVYKYSGELLIYIVHVVCVPGVE